jgi:hypothetical protein
VTIEGARRLAIIRAIREAVATLREAGAESCELSLQRDGEWLRLTITASVDDGPFAADSLDAEALTFAAYGGRLDWLRKDTEVVVTAALPAPGVEVADDGDEPIAEQPGDAEPASEGDDPAEDIDEPLPAQPPQVVTFAAALQADGESLAAALRELAGALPDFDMSLDVADDFERPDLIDGELAGTLRSLVGTAAKALQGAGARSCSVTLRHIHDDVYLSMMSDEGGDVLDMNVLTAAKQGIEARGGQISIGHFEGSSTITVEIPGAAATASPRIVKLDRAPVGDSDAEDPAGVQAGDALELDFGPGSDDGGEDAA